MIACNLLPVKVNWKIENQTVAPEHLSASPHFVPHVLSLRFLLVRVKWSQLAAILHYVETSTQSFRPGSDSLYVKTKTPNKFTRCMRLNNAKHKSSPLRCGPVGALPLHPHRHFSWNFQCVLCPGIQPPLDNQDPKDEHGCPGPSSSSFSPSELSSPPQRIRIFQAMDSKSRRFRTYQCQGILQHPSGDATTGPFRPQRISLRLWCLSCYHKKQRSFSKKYDFVRCFFDCGGW